MGVAAESRWIARQRREYDREAAARAIAPPTRLSLEQEISNLTADLSDANQTIKDQHSQIQRLELEIENLQKQLRMEAAKAQREIEEVQKQSNFWNKSYCDATRQIFSLDNAHKRASAVLRMFAPEQVHKAREGAKEVYPHLWKDADQEQDRQY